MRKVFFIVESPFQLICAYEYLMRYRPSKTIFLVRMADAGSNNIQLKGVIDLLVKNHSTLIFNIPPRSRSLISILKISYITLVVILYYLLGYSFVVGYFGSYFVRIITRLIKKNRIVYLDDGTATLHMPEDYLKSASSFFSIFKLNSDSATQHEFDHFKQWLTSSLAQQKREKSVVFIGSPFREFEYFPEKDYFDLLRLVRSTFNNIQFTYVPHRRELKDDIEKIASLGYKICRTALPIEFLEYEFPTMQVNSVVAFKSTAMFSMYLIYKPKVYFIDVSSRNFNFTVDIISKEIVSFIGSDLKRIKA